MHPVELRCLVPIAAGLSMALSAGSSATAADAPLEVRPALVAPVAKARVAQGPTYSYRKRSCPGGYSCYPLYGAYGPYGGVAFWGAYTGWYR